MQKFEYRTPRYEVDLPVRLTLENATMPGRCREISKEGMKVEFSQPLAPGGSGTLSATYRDLSLELKVVVAHSGVEWEGLKFVFESDRDRKSVERLVALLTEPPPRTALVLVR
jgi:hypothetical protein